jgi:hypothetical protein
MNLAPCASVQLFHPRAGQLFNRFRLFVRLDRLDREIVGIRATPFSTMKIVSQLGLCCLLGLGMTHFGPHFPHLDSGL